MNLLRLISRTSQAAGAASSVAGLSTAVYWLGADGASAAVALGGAAMMASGVAALASSLLMESAETELHSLRLANADLRSQCDRSQSAIRRLERRAEGLALVREIHRSTNIVTRGERLRQVLAVMGELAPDMEAAIFVTRGGGGLRPVASLTRTGSRETFVRFDEEVAPGTVLEAGTPLRTELGTRVDLSADIEAEGAKVGRMELAFAEPTEGTDGETLRAALARLDLGCIGGEVDEHCASRRMRRVEGGGIEFVYPLAAEGSPMGALRIRLSDGEGDLERGIAELDELLAECVRHVALAVKKEADARLAMTDGLTGLYLKREFEPRLADALAATANAGRPLSLLVVDIDHFKPVNDTHGHLTGDHVLRGVAGLVRRHIRTGDSAFRYGGEEMCVLLPDSGTEAAGAIAERLRASVEAARFTTEAGAEIGVTISIGVAVAEGPGRPDAPGLFGRGDRAVYAAKNAGRNRVVFWESRLDRASAKPTVRVSARRDRRNAA